VLSANKKHWKRSSRFLLEVIPYLKKIISISKWLSLFVGWIFRCCLRRALPARLPRSRGRWRCRSPRWCRTAPPLQWKSRPPSRLCGQLAHGGATVSAQVMHFFPSIHFEASVWTSQLCIVYIVVCTHFCIGRLSRETQIYPFSWVSPGIYDSSCWEYWSHLDPSDLKGSRSFRHIWLWLSMSTFWNTIIVFWYQYRRNYFKNDLCGNKTCVQYFWFVLLNLMIRWPCVWCPCKKIIKKSYWKYVIKNVINSQSIVGHTHVCLWSPCVSLHLLLSQKAKCRS